MANYIKRLGSPCCPVSETNQDNEPSQGLVITATIYSMSECSYIIGGQMDAETGDYRRYYCEDNYSKIEIDGVQVDFNDIDSNDGSYCFDSEGEHTIRYTLKEDIVGVPSGLFGGCLELTSIEFPNGITYIGSQAFVNCTNMTSITIPSGVTSIEYQTFCNCESLTSITIPSGVTSIEMSAFEYCSSLIGVTCLPTTPPTLGAFAFDYNASGRKIYVPSDSLNAYKTATNWSRYVSDIEPIS